MTTILEEVVMNVQVQKALEEIRARFSPSEFVVEPDGQGGARIRFGPVALGPSFVQETTWLAGHLPSQIPYADVYPIFVRGDLTRKDGAALTAPITPNHVFMSQQSVQVSRRSNGRDPAVETPALKFAKVLAWLNSQ
jgi:hypothetical protein